MYITPVINQSPCFSGDANIDNNCFMENREQQILSEIKSMVASIRSQLEKLDAKMVEFHQAVDPEGFQKESINVIIDDIDVLARPAETEIVEIPLGLDIPEVLPVEMPVVAPVAPHTETPAVEPVELQTEITPEATVEISVEQEEEQKTEDDDLPFGDLPEDEPEDGLQSESQPDVEIEVEPEPEPESQPEPEPVKEEEPQEEEDDDLPGFFDVPEAVTVAAKASAAAKPTINDAHSTDQAWRNDMPGSPVKDIRSAISLNDRVFFINNLFDEDAQAFVNALTSINSMTSLDEVVEFVTASYPHWNLNSDTVYRFMMAVRRKVN